MSFVESVGMAAASHPLIAATAVVAAGSAALYLSRDKLGKPKLTMTSFPSISFVSTESRYLSTNYCPS